MFKKVTSCRCCGHYKLIKYLDLGEQPLANSYHKGETLPKFPLEVMYCDWCFHNQLSVVVDPDEMFKNYLYVSGTTHTFREHCKNLAHDAVNYYNDNRHLGPGIMMDCWKPPKVLDIACNDGTLLAYFKDIGCNVKGIDPAENLRTLTEEKGIDVVVDYWNKDTDLGEKFNIITGTNVFAHVDDVQGFLAAAVRHLEDWGFAILEFPYCKEMIEKREFDTVYHEHLSYFLVSPMMHLVKRFDELRMHDIVLTPIHGGSIRFVLRKCGGQHCEKLYKMIQAEEHLLTPEVFEKFSEAVGVQKESLNRFLKETTQKVVGYGASAKGNTMLNHFGVTLDYIVDDNPMKWDFLTPGRNIPIYSPQRLADEDGTLFVVLLAWNFAEEIKKKVLAIRSGKTTHFVHYVPGLKVEWQIEEIPSA